jgi:hypothetical protein
LGAKPSWSATVKIFWRRAGLAADFTWLSTRLTVAVVVPHNIATSAIVTRMSKPTNANNSYAQMLDFMAGAPGNPRSPTQSRLFRPAQLSAVHLIQLLSLHDSRPGILPRFIYIRVVVAKTSNRNIVIKAFKVDGPLECRAGYRDERVPTRNSAS